MQRALHGLDKRTGEKKRTMPVQGAFPFCTNRNDC